MIETAFTPLASLSGGILIGVASTLLMLTLGRVMGATGILVGLIQPATSRDFAWRAALLAGMVTGPALVWLVSGGGLIVGVGVSFGSGCASGHGVCGMARLSPRSIVATLTFMAASFATVYVIRHVIGG